MNDVFVRLIDLPQAVRGFVMEDPAGDYNIYINARLASDQRSKTLRHELQHVECGHLDNDPRPVEVKELEAEYGTV